MTGYESFGLLHAIGVSYVGFVTGFGILADEVWGTGATIKQSKVGHTKESRRRVRWAGLAISVPILLICFWLAFPKMLDLPGVMAGEHRSMEGIVTDCIYGREEGGIAITGELSAKDSSGKLYEFTIIHVPRYLEIGDRVKVDYRKYGKSGVIREINGTAFEEFGKRQLGLFRILTRYLLFSMPVYSFYTLKWRYKRDRKKNYSLCVYHDDFVRSIRAVGILRLQSAAVLFIAKMGIYGIILEAYWCLLMGGNYIGIICLSTLRNKKFILEGDKFYYRNFKQEIEGKIEEIEFVERRKEGVVIRAKGEEMKIRCTKEEYVEDLMKKIGKEEKGNDGE